MPSSSEYIQVIVPLKLDRPLTYRVPETLRDRIAVGDRVKVRVGPRLTDAVVSATGVQPDIDPARIKEIAGPAEGLERISAEEIRFWQFISDYYLCTQGEVFKCAYPVGKIRSEETAARVRGRVEASRRKMQEAARLRIENLEAEMEAVNARTEAAVAALSERSVKTRQKLLDKRDKRLTRLQEALESARALYKGTAEDGGCPVRPGNLPARAQEPQPDGTAPEIAEALRKGKPVLLQADAARRLDVYGALIRDTLSRGRSILLLLPEIGLTGQFEAGMRRRFGDAALVFHSRETTVQRRKIADTLREEGPHLLIGTRSALFLPFRGLGLVIVDEEQDRSYKQDSPAPRYNARDCAVVLAGIHGARILLGSGAPSLESLYNCSAGRYTGIGLDADRTVRRPEDGRLLVIDTAAERRKRGMKGSFSIKLLDQMNHTLDQGGTVYLIRLWGDTAALAEETRALFPETPVASLEEGAEDARIRVGTLAQTKRLHFSEGSLAVLIQADPIFAAQDFRADERAWQLLSRYRANCAAGTFVIQTSRSAHPVFQDLAGGREPWPELMEERRNFGFPPFSRIIDIRLEDPNPKRLGLMGNTLAGTLRRTLRPSAGLGGPVRIEGPFQTAEGENTLRVILAKDRQSAARKQALKEAVDAFGRERNYAGFIHLDVDPE